MVFAKKSSTWPLYGSGVSLRGILRAVSTVEYAFGGEEEFRQAETLAREGKTGTAIAAFDRLRTEYRGSWIERVAAERLRTLRHPKDQETP